MKYLIFLTILFLLASCDPSYKIKEEKISSSERIKNAFTISEIDVYEFNDEGRPLNYSDSVIIACAPINIFSVHLSEKTLTQKEKQIYAKNKKIMDSIMALNDNTIGGEGHNQGIDQWITSRNIIDDLQEQHFPFKPKKDIYFKKPNKYYKWIFTDEDSFFDYDREVHDTIPIKFKLEQWYLINFSNQYQLINKLFFKMSKDGIQQFHYYSQPLFGV